MKKIDLIQALRGIAAMLVVLFHVRNVFNVGQYNIGERLFGQGAMGVDLFFIISGFIMVYTSSHREGAKAAIKFMLNRVTRILPLYALITIVFISFFNSHGFNWWRDKANILTFVKSMLFIPSDFHAAPPFYGYALIMVGWTLCYEMLFYLMFAFALIFGKYKWAILYTVFFILLVAVPLAFGNFRTDAFAQKEYRFAFLNFATSPMLLEFLIGILIARLYTSDIHIPVRIGRWLAYASILFFILMYGFEINPGHGPLRYGLRCFFLVFALLMLNKEIELKVPGSMEFLGNISYSVYLLHSTIALFLAALISHLGLAPFESTPVYFPVYLALVILISYGSYYFIEQRLSNKIKSQLFSWLKL
jgi:hypothetical protein